MSAATARPARLDGTALRDAFAAASAYLADSAQAIDAINVYPVPDGDTGANMSATLRQAITHAAQTGDRPSVAQVLAAIAKGSLYGARGNSGVILSQALRGFATGAGDIEWLDAATLARALRSASDAAYRAVSEPKEGTMLTVLRAAAEAGEAAIAESPNRGDGDPCPPLLARAVEAADVAEALTIDQLPALKEARVPDAGGEGVCVILRGLLAAILGELPAVVLMPSVRPVLHSVDEPFGHCTEFMVERAGPALDLSRLRALAESGGNRSVVVVGDTEAAHIHVHSDAPDMLLAAAADLGRVSRVKIDDMSEQHVRFSATGSGAAAAVAVLAFSSGPGFDDVFVGLGAHVRRLHALEKPSAGDIAAAADALGIPDVIVLPNHENVVLAAQQAATVTRCTLRLVPATSMPQGVAACIAFDGAQTALTNIEEMTASLEHIHTIEVTAAAADRVVDGIAVTGGQPMALLDGRLVAVAASHHEVLLAAAIQAAAGATLVTVYGGADCAPDELESARLGLADGLPGIDIEAISGGQALYKFIASVEA